MLCRSIIFFSDQRGINFKQVATTNYKTCRSVAIFSQDYKGIPYTIIMASLIDLVDSLLIDCGKTLT